VAIVFGGQFRPSLKIDWGLGASAVAVDAVLQLAFYQLSDIWIEILE
jgi:hypothetical protein